MFKKEQSRKVTELREAILPLCSVPVRLHLGCCGLGDLLTSLLTQLFIYCQGATIPNPLYCLFHHTQQQ